MRYARVPVCASERRLTSRPTRPQMCALNGITLTLHAAPKPYDGDIAAAVARRQAQPAGRLRELLGSVGRSTDQMRVLCNEILSSPCPATQYGKAAELTAMTLGCSDERDAWLCSWSDVVGFYPGKNSHEDGTAGADDCSSSYGSYYSSVFTEHENSY
jgi:hypothetical protein